MPDLRKGTTIPISFTPSGRLPREVLASSQDLNQIELVKREVSIGIACTQGMQIDQIDIAIARSAPFLGRVAGCRTLQEVLVRQPNRKRLAEPEHSLWDKISNKRARPFPLKGE